MSEQQEEEVTIYGPAGEVAQPPPPELGAGFLERIPPSLLWILAPLFLATALFLLWFYIPGRKSDIAKGAAKTEARVHLKDSRATGEGSMVWSVTFIYPDEQQKNHMAENFLIDQASWDALKPQGYVNVRYLPGQPGMAFLDSAQAIALDTGGGGKRIISLLPPNARALSFVGWSLFWVSFPLFFMAYMASKTERKPKPRGPKVVISRR